MKRILSVILALSMLASMLAMAVSAYDEDVYNAITNENVMSFEVTDTNGNKKTQFEAGETIWITANMDSIWGDPDIEDDILGYEGNVLPGAYGMAAIASCLVFPTDVFTPKAGKDIKSLDSTINNAGIDPTTEEAYELNITKTTLSDAKQKGIYSFITESDTFNGDEDMYVFFTGEGLLCRWILTVNADAESGIYKLPVGAYKWCDDNDPKYSFFGKGFDYVGHADSQLNDRPVKFMSPTGEYVNDDPIEGAYISIQVGTVLTADEAAAAEVDALIAAIGTVTLDSEAAITKARIAYADLPESATVFVKNLKILEDAEKTLASLQMDAIDKDNVMSFKITDVNGNEKTTFTPGETIWVTANMDSIWGHPDVPGGVTGFEGTILPGAYGMNIITSTLVFPTDTFTANAGKDIKALGSTINNAGIDPTTDETYEMTITKTALSDAKARGVYTFVTESDLFNGDEDRYAFFSGEGLLCRWVLTVNDSAADGTYKLPVGAYMYSAKDNTKYTFFGNGFNHAGHSDSMLKDRPFNFVSPTDEYVNNDPTQGAYITIEIADTVVDEAKTQAAAVDAKIAAIGTVTLNSEAKITEARSAYDALSDAAKAYVTGLATLEAAEKKLEELKNAEDEEEELGENVMSFEITDANGNKKTTFAPGETIWITANMDSIWGDPDMEGDVKGFEGIVLPGAYGMAAIASTLVFPTDTFTPKAGKDIKSLGSTINNAGIDPTTEDYYEMSITKTTLSDAKQKGMYVFITESDTFNGDEDRYAFFSGEGLICRWVLTVNEDAAGGTYKLPIGAFKWSEKSSPKFNFFGNGYDYVGHADSQLENRDVTFVSPTDEYVNGNPTDGAYITISIENNVVNEDEIHAAEVDAKIAAIGTVTLDSEAAITAARSAYDALTDTAKAYVTGLATLEAAEAKLQELKTAAKAAAAEVDALIAAIGPVNLDSEADITAARAAYNALSDAEKAYVTGLATLEAAEAKLQPLLQAKAEALEVDAIIMAIGPVTLDSEAAITAARAAYNALPSLAKAFVTKRDILGAAEKELEKLKNLPDEDLGENVMSFVITDTEGNEKTSFKPGETIWITANMDSIWGDPDLEGFVTGYEYMVLPGAFGMALITSCLVFPTDTFTPKVGKDIKSLDSTINNAGIDPSTGELYQMNVTKTSLADARQKGIYTFITESGTFNGDDDRYVFFSGEGVICRWVITVSEGAESGTYKLPIGSYKYSTDGTGEYSFFGKEYKYMGHADSMLDDRDVSFVSPTGEYVNNDPTKGAYITITVEEGENTDAVEALAVDNLISAIGTVTLNSGDKITAAREAYDALSDAAKAYVINLASLESKEAKLQELKVAADKAESRDYLQGKLPRISPKNVKAVANDKKVTVTWDAVERGIKYWVYVGDNCYLSTANTTATFNLPYGTYDITVRAAVKATYGTTSYVAGVSEAYALKVKAPSTVTVTAKATDSSITATWNEVDSAVTYYVTIEIGDLSITAKTSGTSYTLSKHIIPDADYKVIVQAFVPNGSAYKVVKDEFTGRTEKSLYNITSVVLDTELSLLAVEWDNVEGATGYYVIVTNRDTGNSSTVKLGKVDNYIMSVKGSSYNVTVKAIVGGKLMNVGTKDVIGV